MEIFILVFAVVVVSFPLSILFIRKMDSKNVPRGSGGWPILGENAAFALLGFQKFITKRMQKYSGEVFRTSFSGEKTAVLCGAQGNKFIFANDNKLVTSWLPLSTKKLLFPDFGGEPKQAMALLYKFQYDTLKPEALKHYVPLMDALAREQLDRNWNPNSVVKVYRSARKYTFEVVCRLFMNFADSERLSKLLDPFTLFVEGMMSPPFNFPGTAFHRATKAGKVLQCELMKIVEERRKEMTMETFKGQDMLSKVLVLADEEGISDAKVATFFVSLLMASHDSTTSTSTSVINFLAQLPHIYEEVLREQMEIAKRKEPNELLTLEDTVKMKYTWNVVRETLRLLPPAAGGFREATTDLTYGGFTIPKGWKTYWTVHSTHKNPDYFPDPEKFDPSRFEGCGPAPYTYVPFGGGPRMCPGKEFAKLAILVLVHNVVTRFKLEKAIPNEKMVFHAGNAGVRPAHGLPIHLHPHQE